MINAIKKQPVVDRIFPINYFSILFSYIAGSFGKIGLHFTHVRCSWRKGQHCGNWSYFCGLPKFLGNYIFCLPFFVYFFQVVPRSLHQFDVCCCWSTPEVKKWVLKNLKWKGFFKFKKFFFSKVRGCHGLLVVWGQYYRRLLHSWNIFNSTILCIVLSTVVT